MWVKKYLRHFLLVAIGFIGKQAVADEGWSTIVKNVEAVSVNVEGQTATGDSGSPQISNDGRYVVFTSKDKELIEGDTSNYKKFGEDIDHEDIFIYDRQAQEGTNKIQRISVNKADSTKGGNEDSYSPAISADGRYVVFESAADNLGDFTIINYHFGNYHNIFLYALQATSGEDRIKLISSVDRNKSGNEGSSDPAISDNGRYVVFSSRASNLVEGDNNDQEDIFMYDREAKTTNGLTLISKNTQGGGANKVSSEPVISGDGQYVVFTSSASNLVEGDNNGEMDIFIWDRDADEDTNKIKRISVGIAEDGKKTNSNGNSEQPAISSDGRYIVFSSYAENLVEGDHNQQEDIFIYDRKDKTTKNGIQLISIHGKDSTKEIKSSSIEPDISDDGRYVVFSSTASDLIENDNNGLEDTFIYDRSATVANRIRRISIDNKYKNVGGNGRSLHPVISGDGRYVAFASIADNLIGQDHNQESDVFIAALLSDDELAEAGKARAAEARDEAASADTVAAAQDAAAKAKRGAEETAAAATAARNAAEAAGAPAGSVLDNAAVAAEDAALAAAKDAAETAKILADRANKLAENAQKNAKQAKVKADGAQDVATAEQAFDDAETAAAETDKARWFAQAAKETAAAAKAVSADVQQVADAADNTADIATKIADMAEALAEEAKQVAVNKIPVSSIAKVQGIKVISVNSAGQQTGDDRSGQPRISGDGRYVVFTSAANDLVDNDGNDLWDIFIYDRDASGNGIKRISVGRNNMEADGASSSPSISDDGLYVVFTSAAKNLVDNDDNEREDIFIYDQNTQSINAISVNSMGQTGNGGSSNPRISRDGRYVVFASEAHDLVDGDKNDQSDIFIYDSLAEDGTNKIKRISVAHNDRNKGGNGHSVEPAISADGRYVVFSSYAGNLIDNKQGSLDIFIWDRNADEGTNKIKRISVAHNDRNKGGNGHSVEPVISGDGRYVVFASFADNLVAGGGTDMETTDTERGLFIYDRDAEIGNGIQRISADGGRMVERDDEISYYPAISGDGRYVAFHSSSNNLVAGDGNDKDDIFIYNRKAFSGNSIQRISLAGISVFDEDEGDTSEESNGDSLYPDISANGRYVVFESAADNLVDGDNNLVNGDNNHSTDIFIVAFFSEDAVIKEKDKAEAGQAKAADARNKAASVDTAEDARDAMEKAEQGAKDAANAATAARAAAAGAAKDSPADKAAAAAEAAALAAAEDAAATANILANRAEAMATAAKGKAQDAKVKADGAKDATTASQAVDDAKDADAEAEKAKGFAEAAKSASTGSNVDDKADTAIRTADEAKELARQAIVSAANKFREDAEAGQAKAADARNEAASADTVGAARDAMEKAEQGAADALAAAIAVHAVAVGAPADSVVDKAAVAAQDAALAAAQDAAATATILANRAEAMAMAAKKKAQAAKVEADGAQDATATAQAVDNAKAADVEADEARGIAEIVKSAVATPKSTATDAGVRREAIAADAIADTAIRIADEAKELARQAIVSAADKFREDAEAGQAKAADARNEADKAETAEAARDAIKKAEQGAEEAADAATAARAAAAGAAKDSPADKAATAAEAAALAAAQDAAATANILANRAEALAVAAKKKAQDAKVKADGAKDATTTQQAVDGAKAADAEAEKAKGFAEAAKSASTGSDVDDKADTAIRTADEAKKLARQVIVAAANKFKEDADTAIRTADEAKAIVKNVQATTGGETNVQVTTGETKATKHIPGFSLWWGILMVVLIAFIAIRRSNKSA